MSARTEVPTRASLPGIALAAVLAVLLLHTGCSKKTAPETVAPAGYVAVRNAGAGFALAVPADWIQIPLPGDLDEFDKKARELSATNDGLLPAINQARQILQFGGELMAVSHDGRSRVNLTVDKADEKSLEEIAKATVPVLQEGGATELQQEQTTTGAGPALKLTFKYPIPGRGDEVVIANEVQYYVLHKGKSFVITVINGTADVAQAVADSFRLR